MTISLDFPLEKLSCPICRSELSLDDSLRCNNGHEFPIIDGIPSFIQEPPETAMPFEELYERYDSWYDRHHVLFENELRAIKALEITREDSIELGVGTGRFAQALGIEYGLDPSLNALRLAKRRGIKVVHAVAERTPFKDESFENVLIAFTICFVNDPRSVLKEAVRIAREHIVVAIVPRDSPWGMFYESKRAESPFYRVARFYTVDEIMQMLEGLAELEKAYSTLFSKPPEERPERPKEGVRKNAGFVVMAFKKASSLRDKRLKASNI